MSGAPRPPAAPNGAGRGKRLPARSRIRKGSEIRSLLRRGKRRRTSHLDVYFSPSPVSCSRLGLVVPKHRRRIVDRNRLKRRLREVGRTELLPRLREAELEIDVLIRARKEAYEASFDRLRQELEELAESLCSSRSSSD